MKKKEVFKKQFQHQLWKKKIISIKSSKTNVITESQIKMELIINKYIQNSINDLYILINNFNDGINWKSVYKSKEYSG